jgi:peroxiredoxin
MALAKGTQAPDFTLKTKTQDGLKDVSLSQHIGKQPIVLLFYPFSFTGVCTNEMCSISQDLSSFEQLNATVFAISVDSPFTQEEWAKKNNIKLTLLSDFNKDAVRKYDVMYEDFIGFHGVAKRSAFVISKDGKITFSWSTDDPHNLPDFNAIKDTLKS